jgi:hypothetical protein
MVKAILVTAILGMASASFAQQAPDPHYQLITGNNIIQAKNYYLLTLLQQDVAAKKLIESDTALSGMAQRKLNALSQTLATCKNNAACYTEAMKFSPEEIQLVSARLTALYNDNNALGKLVRQHLIPSGAYILYSKGTPQELLQKAWEQDAMGVNFTIGVYAEGKKPNYPLIDSIGYNVNDPRYGSLLYTPAYVVLMECKDSKLFFQSSMSSALQFLEVNERDNAGDYEPMATTANKAAVEKIKTTKWDNYKYSVILVPGAGPEDPTVALSAEGMLRSRMAAVQYQKGLAPFIIVSGGKVHPYKTPYCEATEMKKFRVEKLHIPESAIIIDPHARHTTTNMRNAVRLMFRYGMPISKPAITSTSRGQSMMITNTLQARCQKELQEVPFKNGQRLSETEAEFFPVLDALHINPTEPMDP